jgi:DNA adenine methylase
MEYSMSEASDKLLAMMEGLEKTCNEYQPDIIKAPFTYPGGRERNFKFVLPHLPIRDLYCEPFGGSAAILLARDESRLEIYNDACGGVVSFYRCMRDRDLFERLVSWLELTVNSREEFWSCKNTWKDLTDDVERAGRWYYVSEYSFNSLGRKWGRARSGRSTGVNGRIRRKLKHFQAIHERMANLQVENMDGFTCMRQYDTGNAVFYVDPPSILDAEYSYRHDLDCAKLMEIIFSMKGYVAVSGYENPLYDKQPWTKVFDWDVKVPGSKDTVVEKLWVKESIGRK